MKDREVQGKAELDGVARRESDIVSLVIGLERILLHLLEVGSFCVFSDVAVVVSDHLDEESLRLAVARLGKHMVLDHVDDTLAVALEFGLDAGLVLGKGI